MALDLRIARNMSSEEFSERSDRAWAAAFAQLKAKADAPHRGIECSREELHRWNRSDARCAVVVRHDHPSRLSVKVSAAGDDSKAQFLPLSQINQRPQTTGRFLVAVMPKWLRLKPDILPLIAPSPDLVGDDWTQGDRREWRELIELRDRINWEIFRVSRRHSKSRTTHALSPEMAR
ncbi:hypothetical protein ACSVBT_06905 [Afipia sp. TerB]